LADVGVFEYEAFVGKGVEVGGIDMIVAITPHSVGALLVGEDEEEVGFFHGNKSRVTGHESRVESQRQRLGTGGWWLVGMGTSLQSPAST
jgi:hypothetical protein